MPSKKSSSSKARLAISAILVLSAISLGGCVDYMERRDTITLSAGEAQAWNRTAHVSDPWPPYVMNTQIPGDGQRTAVVIRRYSTGNGEAGGAATSPGTPAAPQ